MTKMLSASGGFAPLTRALPLAAYASEAEPPLLHITTLTTGYPTSGPVSTGIGDRLRADIITI